MIALTESVQNSLVVTGGTVLVTLIGGMVAVITLLIKAGRRGKRVDQKTEQLTRNGGSSVADEVASIKRSVQTLTEGLDTTTAASLARHQQTHESVLELKTGQREFERRFMDYQIMLASERATTNERLNQLQADLRAHMLASTGEVPVTS